MKLTMPTSNQVYTVLRYAGTSAGTIGTIAVLVGLLPDAQSQALVQQFQLVVKDIVQLFGDSSKFVLLAIPVVTMWLAKLGWNSAAPDKQMERALEADPKKLVAAVQSLPAAQVTVTDPKLAEGIPGVKVDHT